MNTTLKSSTVIKEVLPEKYLAANGFTAQREDGVMPNGNPFYLLWVLRDPSGNWVDVDPYRHSLFENNGLRTAQ